MKRVDSAAKKVKKKVKKAAKKVVKDIKSIKKDAKQKIKQIGYDATSWHFEKRAKHNGKHPAYSDVKNSSKWELLPPNYSKYHDDGKGRPEEKYITSDGREAVFDGDTKRPMQDPRYIATYNYVPPYAMPRNNERRNLADYAKWAICGAGHVAVDVIPYYIFLKSNTRRQYEQKINHILYGQ